MNEILVIIIPITYIVFAAIMFKFAKVFEDRLQYFFKQILIF
jgi:hypothetical protein